MQTDPYIQIAGMIGGTEIIVILLAVLIFFGGKKIPELMKGLGKGIREYKKAVKGVEDELSDAVSDETESKD
jgi:sec-independent protein translocase protein TatA